MELYLHSPYAFMSWFLTNHKVTAYKNMPIIKRGLNRLKIVSTNKRTLVLALSNLHFLPTQRYANFTEWW